MPLRLSFDVLMKETDHLSDVTLTCQGKEYKCHKVILASVSDVFQTMFKSGKFIESREKCVIAEKKASLDVFERFLRFIYNGTIQDLEKYAFELYQIADRYQVLSLREICSRFLQSCLNVENVLDALLMGYCSSDQNLEHGAMEMIVKHRGTFKESKDFQDVVKRYPELHMKVTIALAEQVDSDSDY